MTVLAGGRVCDGTGGAAVDADVYLRDGRIDDVRPSSDDHRGWNVVDVRGCVVAPGFIDVHSHGDNAPFAADDRWKIEQGITTEVVGNCGISLGPHDPSEADAFFDELSQMFAGLPRLGSRFGDVLAEADRCGYVTNYAPLVGHGNLRRAAMGTAGRTATSAETARMVELLVEALDAGAFGISTGLIYPPGMFADADELATLAAALGPEHVFTSHMRNESDDVVASIEEIVRIGERSGRRVHVSHHKTAGAKNWGRSEQTLRMLAAARARGVAVTQDAYPYTAGSTSLSATLPRRYHDGGRAAVLRRLQEPNAVDELRAAIERGEPGWENLAASAGWDGILIASTRDHRFEGATIAQIAAERGWEPVRALVHVLLEEELEVWMVAFLMDEGDVERILADPHTSIGTDGAPPRTGGRPHPRTFGTFPRILGRYVRERGLLSLPEAIRRMTSLAADTFGIADRGRVVAGGVADLVVFDPRTVAGDADYLDPVRPPRGVRAVLQGGEMVVADGRFVGGRHGRRLRPVLPSR
jgi:N-acyl-D-aspartate/D-glutamate deacylase